MLNLESEKQILKSHIRKVNKFHEEEKQIIVKNLEAEIQQKNPPLNIVLKNSEENEQRIQQLTKLN